MNLQRERAHDITGEIAPLLRAHHLEVAPFNFPLQPNIELYCGMEDAGALRCYTLRMDSLVGYAIYIVTPSPHYVQSRQANNDILYVRPDMRGHSLALMRYAEAELGEEGVGVIYQNTTRALDFGKVLVRLGYEHIENVYAKPLNPEVVWPQQRHLYQ